MPLEIAPDTNPGGLVAMVWSAGRIFDPVKLTADTVDAVGARQATMTAELAEAGFVAFGLVYDGDSGELVSLMRVDPE